MKPIHGPRHRRPSENVAHAAALVCGGVITATYLPSLVPLLLFTCLGTGVYDWFAQWKDERAALKQTSKESL